MFDLTHGIHRVKNSFITLTYYVFDTHIHIDYIEVSEEFRNKGFAKQVIESLKQQTCKDLTLVCLDESLEQFYKNLRFDKVGHQSFRYINAKGNKR